MCGSVQKSAGLFGSVLTLRGAALGRLLVGPEAGGAVRRRVALHDELAPPRRAALLQHAVLRRARARRVPRHRQPRDGVVDPARRAARRARAAPALRTAARPALLHQASHFNSTLHNDMTS